MPRTPRGPIDLLVGYTFLDPGPLQDPPLPPDPPEDDYYVTADGKYTIWGVGLITFGPQTDAQQDWIADPANYSDLSTFPTDWVSFGFPMAQTSISYWQGVTWVKNQVLLTEQGVSGANSWSIGGLSGTGTFYFSDVAVTNGTNVGETMNGTSIAETLNGLEGNDVLNGGGGSDALYGGEGNDTLNGGDGIDRLWGGEGDDILAPGSDDAFIYIEGGLNREGVYYVNGGAGTDTLVLDYSTATKAQSISGDQVLASDQVIDVEAVSITGSQYSDFLSGSSGDDKLFGGGGFDFLSSGGGNDTLDAGAPGASSVATIGPGGHSSDDALSLDHLFVAGTGFPSVSFSIDAVETKVSDEWGLRPPAGNIYSFTVGAGAEALINYTSDGGFGGGEIVEFHITDADDAAVWDWTPSDPSDPQPPLTFLDAGTYYLEVIIFNQNPWDTASIDVTLSLEGAEVLASNVLEGGAGDDTYIVSSASDQVIEIAGEGNDTVRSSVSLSLADNVENLTLSGPAAINGIGNELGNQLTGNGGRNVLVGGDGSDTLRGAAAGDVFVFTESELGTTRTGEHDVIADWQRGDRIDISALYEGVTFKGLKNGKASDVDTLSNFRAITYTEGGKTYISGDTDGIAGADFTIELTGSFKLKSGDLIVNTSQWNQATGGLDYDAYHYDSLRTDPGII